MPAASGGAPSTFACAEHQGLAARSAAEDVRIHRAIRIAAVAAARSVVLRAHTRRFDLTKPSPLSFARAHAAALACRDGHGRLCVECTHTRARPLAVGRWALLLQAAQGDLDAKRTSQAKLVSGGTEPRVGHRVLVSSTLHVVL